MKIESQKLNSAKFAAKRSTEGLKIFTTLLDKRGLIYDSDVLHEQYINRNSTVKIVCPIHGEFESEARVIIKYKNCCPIASRENSNKGWYKTQEEVINNFVSVHSTKYDYSKVIYERENKEITIICKKHGEFKQTPGIHLKGYGCRKCSANRYELRIAKFLDDHKVQYHFGYTVPKFSKIKKFDFYVNNGFLLEYDGIQHYKPTHGKEKFERQQFNDVKATSWCKENKLPLLRIPYNMSWENQKKTILEWVSNFGA